MKKMLTEWRQFLKEQEMSQEDFRKMQVGKYAEAMNDLLDQDRKEISQFLKQKRTKDYKLGRSLESDDVIDFGIEGTDALDGFGALIGLAIKFIPNQVDDFIAKYKKDPKGVAEDILAVSLPKLADNDFEYIGPGYYDDSHYTEKLMDYSDKARRSGKISSRNVHGDPSYK